MISVNVDGQLTAGDPAFDNETKIKEHKFKSHPRKYDRLSFTRVEISQQPDGCVVMNQRPHAECIQLIPKHCTFADFRSRLHELEWLGHTRPDVKALANIASKINHANFAPKHVKPLNDCIKHVKHTQTVD